MKSAPIFFFFFFFFFFFAKMSFPVQCCRIIISIRLLFSGTVNDNNCDGNFFSKLEKPIRVNLNNFHPTVILHDFRDAVKPQSIVASRKLV